MATTRGEARSLKISEGKCSGDVCDAHRALEGDGDWSGWSSDVSRRWHGGGHRGWDALGTKKGNERWEQHQVIHEMAPKGGIEE